MKKKEDPAKPRVILPNGISADTIVEVAQRHGARNVRVFGSFARGEARPDSDLDLLMDFETGRDLFDLVGIKLELESVLGRTVDVMTENSLSRYMRDDIIREAVPL